MKSCVTAILLAGLPGAPQVSGAPPPGTITRVWTDIRGREIEAALLAFDNVRATLLVNGVKAAFVPPRTLGEPDRAFLKNWRDKNPTLPWVDPNRMPPWPVQAGTGTTVIQVGDRKGITGAFSFRSPHFEIRSDAPILAGAVRDVATVLEATRDLVYSLPLGLRARPLLPKGFIWVDAGAAHPYDPDHLFVRFFSTPEAYAAAGAPAGSGGSYAVHRREMVISLRNFGIFTDDGRQVHDYRKNLFVLKHEVTHQLLHHWIPFLPLWLNEGFPEYIAALHLQDGRYNLREREAAFLRYLNKWRPRDEDTRAIRMLHPARLLTLSHQQWQSALQMETAVLNYNSAALLTYYFLHQDGTGNGAPLAAFLDALRLDVLHPSEHIKKHLLRSRTPESIAFHLQGQWRKKGVKIEFVDG